MEREWYELNNPEEVDSPALLVFKERVASNIQTMINLVGDAKRLVPHVKTHKMAEIVKMQLNAGIHQFKCATIAEAEMLAEAEVENILMAYQLNISKAKRLISLITKFSKPAFSSLVDNWSSAKMLNDLFAEAGLTANVYIDVDAGMHRTGVEPNEKLFELYLELVKLPNVHFKGLHIYDGHIRDENFELRKLKADEAFTPVNAFIEKIKSAGFPQPKVIAGGTPTFTVHALQKEEYCSPGTCLLWDYGYDLFLHEQPFEFAAVLITRVISKPVAGMITTDLGHKSVAAESPVSKRIFFLNLKDYEVRSQSEEHLVVEVKDWEKIAIGDLLYGIPYHICPSVALYDEACIVEDGAIVDKWKIEARKKKITF